MFPPLTTDARYVRDGPFRGFGNLQEFDFENTVNMYKE
jgi:hypothetical protein